MKILLICPYFFEPHRWMISAYKTANYLSKEHKVVVLTTGKPAHERLSDNLVVYRMWDIFLPDPINYSIVPGLPFAILKVLWKERPTHFLVNKHMFFTSFSVLILRLLGKKVVTATDTFPGINWLPRRPLVANVMRLYSTLFGMPMLKLSNRIVLFHEGLLEIAERYHLRATVIHNGVDLAAIDNTPANEEFQDKRYITIVYAGRLESIKGYLDLAEVAKRLTKQHKNVRFVFIGSTHGKEAWVRSVANERILFLGHRTDVISLLKASDIFTLASYSEGLPNAVMEAMACGLPTVCSNVGGVPYLIRENKNGLLFTPGNQDELATKLEKLVLDTKLRTHLGKQARQTIEQSYSWESIAKQYSKLLGSLS